MLFDYWQLKTTVYFLFLTSCLGQELLRSCNRDYCYERFLERQTLEENDFGEEYRIQVVNFERKERIKEIEKHNTDSENRLQSKFREETERYPHISHISDVTRRLDNRREESREEDVSRRRDDFREQSQILNHLDEIEKTQRTTDRTKRHLDSENRRERTSEVKRISYRENGLFDSNNKNEERIEPNERKDKRLFDERLEDNTLERRQLIGLQNERLENEREQRRDNMRDVTRSLIDNQDQRRDSFVILADRKFNLLSAEKRQERVKRRETQQRINNNFRDTKNERDIDHQGDRHDIFRRSESNWEGRYATVKHMQNHQGQTDVRKIIEPQASEPINDRVEREFPLHRDKNIREQLELLYEIETRRDDNRHSDDTRRSKNNQKREFNDIQSWRDNTRYTGDARLSQRDRELTLRRDENIREKSEQRGGIKSRHEDNRHLEDTRREENNEKQSHRYEISRGFGDEQYRRDNSRQSDATRLSQRERELTLRRDENIQEKSERDENKARREYNRHLDDTRRDENIEKQSHRYEISRGFGNVQYRHNNIRLQIGNRLEQFEQRENLRNFERKFAQRKVNNRLIAIKNYETDPEAEGLFQTDRTLIQQYNNKVERLDIRESQPDERHENLKNLNDREAQGTLARVVDDNRGTQRDAARLIRTSRQLITNFDENKRKQTKDDFTKSEVVTRDSIRNNEILSRREQELRVFERRLENESEYKKAENRREANTRYSDKETLHLDSIRKPNVVFKNGYMLLGQGVILAFVIMKTLKSQDELKYQLPKNLSEAIGMIWF